MNFTINDRTKGVFTVSRDFYNNMWPNLGITLYRDLPCSLQLVLNASISQSYNNDRDGTQTDHNISASLQFTAQPAYEITPRESLLPEDTISEPYSY